MKEEGLKIEEESVELEGLPFDPFSNNLTEEQKKYKNKINARNTRKRKKNYIDRLEGRIKQLETEVSELKKENELL